MGNIASNDSSSSNKDDGDSDQKYLSFQPTALFNDSFISSLVNNLPLYGFPDDVKNQKEKVVVSPSVTNDVNQINESQQQRLQKLISIFATNMESSCKVEDYDILSLDKNNSQSSFFTMENKRGRLLVRMFEAYRNNLAQAKIESKASSLESKNSNSRKFWINEIPESETSQNPLLGANGLSLDMCIAMAKAFVAQDTMLLAILKSLLQSLSVYTPVTTPSTTMTTTTTTKTTPLPPNTTTTLTTLLSNTTVKHQLHAILTFVQDIASTSTHHEVKQVCISLQLTIGILLGSIHIILESIDLISAARLTDPMMDFALPSEILPLLTYCLKYLQPHFELSFPSELTPEDTISMTVDGLVLHKTLPVFSLAADSDFVYVYDARTCNLYKLGNGVKNTTVPGELIATKASLDEVISTFKKRLAVNNASGTTTLATTDSVDPNEPEAQGTVPPNEEKPSTDVAAAAPKKKKNQKKDKQDAKNAKDGGVGASLTVINGQLFLRLEAKNGELILKNSEIAIFDCHSLECVDIIDLSDKLSASVTSIVPAVPSGTEATFRYEYDLQKDEVPLCIQCKQGFTLVVQEVLLNGSTDITAAFRLATSGEERSHQIAIVLPDVLAWIRTAFPAIEDLRTLQVIGQLKYAPTVTDYALPITSFGYDLVLCQRVFLPAQFPNPIQAKSKVYEYTKCVAITGLELPPLDSTATATAAAPATENRKFTDAKTLQELQSLWQDYVALYVKEKVAVSDGKPSEALETLKKRTQDFFASLATHSPAAPSNMNGGATEDGEEVSVDTTARGIVLPPGQVALTYSLQEADGTILSNQTVIQSELDWSVLCISILNKVQLVMFGSVAETVGTVGDDRFLYQAVIVDTKHQYQVVAVHNLHVTKAFGMVVEPLHSTLDDRGPFPLDPHTSLVYNHDELAVVYHLKVKCDDDANSVLHRVWKYDLTTSHSLALPVTSWLPHIEEKRLVEFHLSKSNHTKVPLRFAYDFQNELLWSVDAHTLALSRFPVTTSCGYAPYLFHRGSDLSLAKGATTLEEDEQYLTYAISDRWKVTFPGLQQRLLHTSSSNITTEMSSYWKSLGADQVVLLLSQWLEAYSAPYHPKASSLGSLGGTSTSEDLDSLYSLKCVARCVESSSDSHEHKLQVYWCNQLVVFGAAAESPATETIATMNSTQPIGYNIIVFHPQSMQILSKRQFNNEDHELATEHMAEYLESLPVGTPICVVNVNCIHDHMLSHHYELLAQFGCPMLQHHYNIRSLIFFGRKGLAPGMAEYTVGQLNETITLQRILTNTFVPLQLEATIDTNVQLLKMLSRLLSNLFPSSSSNASSAPSAASFSLFLSWLRLFQSNIHHYVSKHPLQEVLTVMQDTKVLIDTTNTTFYQHLKGFISRLLANETLMHHPIFQNIALSIYITNFDVLTMNSVSEKLTLLQSYVEDYEKQRASSTQLMILEVMLRRLSSWKGLVTWQSSSPQEKDDLLDLSAIHHMIGLCQRIVLQENEALMKHILSSKEDPSQSFVPVTMNSMYSTAVNVLFSLLNVSMTCDLELLQVQQNFSTSSTPKKFSKQAAEGFPNMLSSICLLCAKVLTGLMPYVQAFVSSAKTSSPAVQVAFYQHLSTFLQQSPVGVVLPQITLATSHILREHGYPFIKSSMEGCLALIDALDGCLSAFNSLLTILPSEYTDYSDALCAPPTIEKMFESPHNYLSNMNDYIPIRFPPGVVGVTITFDAQSKTENGCDYVQFLDINNKQSLHPSIEKFTGRDGNENWPGTGGRPPLVLTQNEFYLHFHSDGSVEDWGYKFTCVATYPLKSTNTYRHNWCQRLVFQLTRCLSTLGSTLLVGPAYDTMLEVPSALTPTPNGALLACQALAIKPESFQYYEPIATKQSAGLSDKEIWTGLTAVFTQEEIAFLRGFFLSPTTPTTPTASSGEETSSSSLTEKFVKKMKLHCLEDQGKIAWINTAVYATGAALLVKYKLVREAVDFTKGTVRTPSTIMIKIWKQIQSIRSKFKVPNNFIASGGGNGTPTVPLVTVDEEQTVSIALPILLKAKFLAISFAMNQVGDGFSRASDTASVEEPEIKALSKATGASPYRIPLQRSSGSNSLLSPGSSFVKEDDVVVEFGTPSRLMEEDDLGGTVGIKAEEDDTSEGSLSPMNRSLLLRRQISDDTQNTVKMWDSLVNTMDTTIIQRIKSSFFRPASTPKSAAPHDIEDELSACRKVLEFTTNATISLDTLQPLNRLHNKRCIARAKGYDVFGRLLNFAKNLTTNKSISPFAVYLNHYLYLEALHKIKESSMQLTAGTISNTSSTTTSPQTVTTSFGLHYGHGLEASSHDQFLILYDRIGVFFRLTVQIITCSFTEYVVVAKAYDSCTVEETEEQERLALKDKLDSYEKAIIACLQACCMDYVGSDEQLITESGLLRLLQMILSSSEVTGQSSTGLTLIKSLASSVLEVLVGRFILSASSASSPSSASSSSSFSSSSLTDGGHASTDAPETLISQLLRTLTGLLSDSLQQNPALSARVQDSLPIASPTPLQVLPLTPYASSYVLPHTTIPFPHSIVFGISRLSSAILDTPKASMNDFLHLQVMKCEDFLATDKVIAIGEKYGIVGEIIEIHEEQQNLKIRWKGGVVVKEMTYSCTFNASTGQLSIGKENEGRFAVIDPLIGGYIFCKGCAGIESDTDPKDEVVVPKIVHISAQLLPDATLLVIYQLNTTADSGVFLKSTTPIPSLEASLITISCDLSGAVTVWLNDTIVATQMLPMPKDWLTTIGEFESKHPLVEQLSFDKLLPVKENPAVVGLSFDPKSDLGSPSAGSLVVSTSDPNAPISATFPTDPTQPNLLPGVNGQPMWFFPANTFANSSEYQAVSLQYHKAEEVVVTEGSETTVGEKSEAWGFKLLLQSLSKNYTAGQNVASQFPIYLGGVPNYFKHFLHTENTTMPGMLYHFEIEEKILSKEEMMTLQTCVQTMVPVNSSWRSYSETPVLTILAIIKKAVEHANNGVPSSQSEGSQSASQMQLKQYFVSSGLVPIVCRLMHPENYSTATICAAYHIASLIFPYLDSDYVETIALESGILLVSNDVLQQEGMTVYDSLLEMLIDTIGSHLNCLAEHYVSHPQMTSLTSSKTTSRNYSNLRPAVEQQAIVDAKLKLLHAFSVHANSKWFSRLMALLEQSLVASVTIFSSLSSLTKQAFAEVFDTTLYMQTNGTKYPYVDPVSALKQLKEANILYFLIAFFGGMKSSPTIGSLAYYRDENNASNMAEIVTILGPTPVPKLNAKEDKIEAKKWEKLSHFGDATAIVFPMQSTVMVVPTHTLIPLSTDKHTIEHLITLVGKHLPVELFNGFWQLVSEIPTADVRPQPVQKEKTEDVELKFESTHPYADNLDHYEDISVPGAESLEVIFDATSRTEHRHDFVCFYKTSAHTTMFGDKYSGRDGDQNWPGCEGRPSLIIPASSCVLHFHSDSSTNDWGYKFVVKAIKKEIDIPPPLPTIPSLSIAVDLKMMGLKALSGLMSTKNPDLITNMLPLLPAFLSSSLAPKPTTTIFRTDEFEEIELMYESSHPYEDSLDVYTPITVPNATKLIITFDPQTRTENNCDYLIFYTDNSHNTKVPGSETYTGGKDGSASNWPGTNNHPPLVIEGNSFVTYFHSDSSVNDWGYRMYISAEIRGNAKKMPCVRGKNMSSLQAERSCTVLTHYLQDGLGSIPTSVYAKLINFPFQTNEKLVTPKTAIFAQFLGPDTSSIETEDVPPSICIEEESKSEDRIIESKEDDEVGGIFLDSTEECHQWVPKSEGSTKRVGPTYRIPKTFTAPNHNKCKVIAEKLTVYSSQSKESSVLKDLTQNAILQIVQDKGEWLKIEFEEELPSVEPEQPPAVVESTPTEEAAVNAENQSEEVNKPPPAGPRMEKKEGFVLRRDGETFFVEMLRETVFVYEINSDQQCAPTKPKAAKKEKKKEGNNEGKINPMYTVQDSISSSSTNSNALSKGKISSYALLQSEFGQIESAITEYATIAAIGYAQECTAMIFKHWPVSNVDTLKILSEPMLYGELINYLNNCIADAFEEVESEDSKSSVEKSPASSTPSPPPVSNNKDENLDRAKAIMQLLMLSAHSSLESSAPSANATGEDVDSLSHRTIILANKILSNTLEKVLTDSSQSIPSIYGGDISPRLSLSNMADAEEAVPPCRRGFIRHIESKHPYDNNANDDYVISFPGALRIEIQFNPQSSTETNYDFLTIYDHKKETKLYEPKIHGYTTDNNRHWPGVNVPKVVLEGVDSCVINFTSDGGTNSWGFSASVWGVMEEATPEEITQFEASAGRKVSIGGRKAASVSPLSTTFAIWMIHYLCNIVNTLSKPVKSDLFTVDTFRLLAKCFVEFSNKPGFALKSELLEIFVVFIQELTSKYLLANKDTSSSTKEFEAALQEIVLEFAQLEKTLLSFGQELYNEDVIDTGKNFQNVSVILQATVQLLITIDNAINQLSTKLEKDLFNLDETVGSNVVLQELPSTLTTAGGSQSSYKTFVEQTVSYPPSAVILGWDIILEKITGEFPIIGITLSRENTGSQPLGQNEGYFELGFRQNSLFFNGKHVVEYNLDGKVWKEGDVLSVIYDKIYGMVTFAVNRFVLSAAIGPCRMQPAIEMPFTNRKDVHLAISLANPGEDKIRVLTKKVINRKVPPPNSSNGGTYQWLDAVKKVDSILQSLSTSQIPPYIIMNKFVPLCHKQSIVDINITSALIDTLFEAHPDEKEAAAVAPVSIEEVIHIPSSKSLYFIFKDLQLSKDDLVELIDVDGNVKLRLTDVTTIKSSIHNIDAHLHKITVTHLDTRSNRLNPRPIFKVLEVGDRVVRGPDWRYGLEDGGHGSLGTVTKLTNWKSNGTGVMVKWDAYPAEDKLYRYTSSKHDVTFASIQYLATSSASSIVTKLDSNAVYLASGINHLTLRLTLAPPSSEGSSERKFECIIIPSFSISYCLNAPQFDRLKQQFQKLYVPKSRSAIAALVKHINALAKSKSWKRDEILTRPWSDIAPSGEALTRSNALKELFDAESVELEDIMDHDIAALDTKKLLTEEVTKPSEADGQATVPTEGTNNEESAGSGHEQGASQESDDESSEESVMSNESLMRDLQGDPEAIAQILGADYMEQRAARRAARREARRNERRRQREASNQSNQSASNNNPSNNSGETAVDSSAVPPASPTPQVRSEVPPSSTPRPNTQRRQRSRWDDSEENEEEPEEEDAEEEDEEDEERDEDGEDEVWEDASEEDEENDSDDDDDDDEDGDEYTESVESSDVMSSDDEDNSGDDESEGSDSDRSHSRTPQREQGGTRRSALLGFIRRGDRSTAQAESGGASSTTSASHSGCDHVMCGKCSKRIKKHPAGTWNDGWACDWPQHEGSNAFRGTDIVYGCDTIMECNWGVCEACWNKISADSLDQFSHKAFANSTKTTRPIEAICSIIQILNIALIKALPFIDLRKGQHIVGTLSNLVSTNRDLVLESVKKGPFEQALSVTATTSGGVFDLPLSRFKARRFAAEGKVDTEGRWTVYSQAFRVIHAFPPAQIRRDNKLYTTKFIGEHAQDAGGPYRESFDIYCQELQSSLLPLMIRTPNGKDGVGYNREKWIFNPAATTTTQLEMFAFLGKLMGVAIRSKEYLALNIPSLIWKLIIKEQPTMEDIEGIEFNLAKSLQLFRTIDSLGITAESFQDTFFETFTTTSLSGEKIELLPGGRDIPVTFHNRFQYCDLVLQYRLHEFDKQANAVREGLSTIVPITLLSLYTWEQVEEMVCGCPEIDITLLESIAEYSSCSKDDAHIRLFWDVLHNDFSNEERSALIRFTWGRSRLPLTADGFNQRFKIQSFDRSPPDSYFPVAHTCFFSLDLPRYSSKEIMKERLLYAIFNCHAIDADDTGAGSAAAAMLAQEMAEE